MFSEQVQATSYIFLLLQVSDFSFVYNVELTAVFPHENDRVTYSSGSFIREGRNAVLSRRSLDDPETAIWRVFLFNSGNSDL